MLPLILQPFGCRETGTEKPPDEPPEPFDPHTFTKELGSWDNSSAMPLVPISNNERFNEGIQRFQNEEDKVSFRSGSPTTRMIGGSTESLDLAEYLLTHSGMEQQDVYAMASGYLHYLHDGKSYDKIFGGAVPNPGEEIFVFKPLATMNMYWAAVQPGKGAFLQESAYLNIEIDFDDLLDHIKRATTLSYHKQIYKQKKGVEWSGAADAWPAAYLELFKEFPDVPILVQGGTKIGSTTANTPSGQRLSMFFKFDEEWTGHATVVQTFFKHHQRNYGIAGHPLIANLTNLSVSASTVDLLAPLYDIADGYPILRGKSKLGSDFYSIYNAGSLANAEYHPLALDPDQSPQARLIVPKPPVGDLPPYLAEALQQHEWETKLKISNPMAQTITIDGFDPAEVSFSLLTADNAAETTFKVCSQTLPQGIIERVVQVKANGTVVHELKLAFLDFYSFPVKFYKLDDTNPNNPQTSMDETKLREIIACANEILGRQSNVYLYPVKEGEVILHDFTFDGDLKDPIYGGDESRNGVRDVYNAFTALSPQLENIKVVFVWDEEIEPSLGVTYAPVITAWEFILIDTLVFPAVRSLLSTPRLVPQLARTLVHELGHWFSNTFLLIKQGLPPCSDRHKHFDHAVSAPFEDKTGCPGGDWEFSSNLMTAGETNMLITADQASVFYENAGLVRP